MAYLEQGMGELLWLAPDAFDGAIPVNRLYPGDATDPPGLPGGYVHTNIQVEPAPPEPLPLEVTGCVFTGLGAQDQASDVQKRHFEAEVAKLEANWQDMSPRLASNRAESLRADIMQYPGWSSSWGYPLWGHDSSSGLVQRINRVDAKVLRTQRPELRKTITPEGEAVQESPTGAFTEELKAQLTPNGDGDGDGDGFPWWAGVVAIGALVLGATYAFEFSRARGRARGERL